MTTCRPVFSAACLALCASAHANVYQVDFSATDFHDYEGATPAQNQVTGSITYTAESAYSNIMEIDGINLVLGGHTYTTGEIDQSNWGTGLLFGGPENLITAVASFTDDFFLLFYPDGFYAFAYATTSTNYYVADTGTVTVTDLGSAVPEPGSVALLFGGLAGWALASRRASRLIRQQELAGAA